MVGARDFAYSLLRPENYDEVVEFVKKEFLTREPLNLGCHTENTPFPARTRNSVIKSLASGVSFGARSPESGVLVGVILSAVGTRNEETVVESAEGEIADCRSMVYSILNDVESKVDIYEEPSVHLTLKILILCVHRKYGGRGIARELVKLSMECGKTRGCHLAAATPTNMLSGRIFQRLGYETRYTLDMSTPEGDRGLDLSKMEGNKLVFVMTKRL